MKLILVYQKQNTINSVFFNFKNMVSGQINLKRSSYNIALNIYANNR